MMLQFLIDTSDWYVVCRASCGWVQLPASRPSIWPEGQTSARLLLARLLDKQQLAGMVGSEVWTKQHSDPVDW